MKIKNYNFKKTDKIYQKNGSKVKNSTKNAINSAIISKISKDFAGWVNGVEEDDPIKREAKNIYFLLEFKQNDIALSYSADEKYLKIFDYGAYFPLEAEYIHSKDLRELSKKLFETKMISKSQVFEMLKKVVAENIKHFKFFKGHNVFFGVRLTKNQASNCLAKL